MSYTINMIKHLCQTLITLKRFSEHFSKFNQATLLNYKLNKEIHQNNQGDKKTKYNLIQQTIKCLNNCVQKLHFLKKTLQFSLKLHVIFLFNFSISAMFYDESKMPPKRTVYTHFVTKVTKIDVSKQSPCILLIIYVHIYMLYIHTQTTIKLIELSFIEHASTG